MRIVRICLLSLSAAAIGCATPKVRHAELHKELKLPVDDAPTFSLLDTHIETLSGITYQATGSLLRIDEELGDEEKAAGTFTGASLPIATGDSIYVVYPKGGAWEFTRTYLGAIYVPNTRLLSNLGVQVKDDRKQVVTALGSVLTALVATGAMAIVPDGRPDANAKPIFPFVHDAVEALDDLPPAERRKATKELPIPCPAIKVDPCKKAGLVAKKEKCGTVKYGPLPDDAVLRTQYLTAVGDKWTDTFPVPACRSAKLVLDGWTAVQDIDIGGSTMSWAAHSDVTLETVVSDSSYVRVVRLPATGGITFHPSCGADVSVGEIATDPIWAAIAELGAQAKAIKEAQDEGN